MRRLEISTRESQLWTYGKPVTERATAKMKLRRLPSHKHMESRTGRSLQSPPLGVSVRALWHRRRLDRELAAGCACDAPEDRAWRARQLAHPVTRRRMARSLRSVVDDAALPATAGLSSAVPVCRKAVVPWREGLLGLADRLEQPGPVNPCRVARTLALLTDGRGPLYNPVPDRSIGEAVWWVADGLAPCPPHAWGCPVVMKLDPEHVAWTCGRCGAITMTDDPAVRPA
jgi:hypothetical protein